MTKTDKKRLNAFETETSEYKNEPRESDEDQKTTISGLSKAHLRYWEEAIYQRREGGNWWVQIQHRGHREKLTLGTPLKSAAAEKARSIYQTLVANGWEEVLATYKPEKLSTSLITLGDFLAELKLKADLKPKTFEGYAIALRKIVADAFEIDGGREKYDYHKGGYRKWLERVHTIELAKLTPAIVQQWKRSFIARAGDDPIRLRTARISVNSFIRRAKSLFAPDALKHLSAVLPSPLPFEGISFEPRQSMRYRSSMNVKTLMLAAQKELAPDDPPAFLAFLLALGAGLRRIEIDRLEWDAFRWNENVIRIEPTQYFDVKSEHSIGDVPLDPELMSLLRGYAARAQSTFVIETRNLPRRGATFEHYRAHSVFERLTKWLRKKGVNSRKPIHELRKEFGSMVNRKHGLSAAKDLLRHADISITAAHYVDSPRQATSGLGALLGTKGKGKKIIDFKDAAKAPTRARASRARTAQPPL